MSSGDGLRRRRRFLQNCATEHTSPGPPSPSSPAAGAPLTVWMSPCCLERVFGLKCIVASTKKSFKTRKLSRIATTCRRRVKPSSSSPVQRFLLLATKKSSYHLPLLFILLLSFVLMRTNINNSAHAFLHTTIVPTSPHSSDFTFTGTFLTRQSPHNLGDPAVVRRLRATTAVLRSSEQEQEEETTATAVDNVDTEIGAATAAERRPRTRSRLPRRLSSKSNLVHRSNKNDNNNRYYYPSSEVISLEDSHPFLATPSYSSSSEGEPGATIASSSSSSSSYEMWDLSLKSFNMDLHNLALDDPRKAEDAVQIMTELYFQQQQNKTSNKNEPSSSSFTAVLPDASCYTTVLDGYIQAGQLEEAQRVLDFMEQESASAGAAADNNSNNNSTLFLAPTDLTYLLMAQAWANDVQDDFCGRSAERAVQVLRRMQAAAFRRQKQKQKQGELNATGSSSSTDSTGASTVSSSSSSSSNLVKVWSIVVEGWCKRAGKTRDAMKRAEALLDEMEAAADADTDDDNNNNLIVRPNVLTYTSYIGGLSRSRQPDLARQAEAVLERMERHGVPPDVVAYTAVLHCYAKAVSRRERQMAASRAVALLQEMERLYIQKEVYRVKPSLITYAAAISAIGNSLDNASAPRLAEGVLQRMYQLSRDGVIANLKPVTATYNAVLYALSRAPVANRLKYAERAENMLHDMERRAATGNEKDVAPDVRTWATVLRAWTRSRQPDAAEQAARVLNEMEERYRSGKSTVRPNFVCFTTVMGAWGYSKRKDALDKMEAILQRMETEYEETQEADVRPNTVSYVTCIDAFVRRNDPDSAQRAEAVVKRMMKLYDKGLGHVKPTNAVFNCVLNAWSRSKDPAAPRKAEEIFQWMETQYRTTGDHLVRPNEVSLCAVLNAWANHAENGGAERAMQIWKHHMNSVSDEERGFRPTIAIPNTVIKAVARSKDPDAVRKAEGILLRLEEDYRSGASSLRPDVTTYSSVINACAYCAGDSTKRAEALETALRTFHKLCAMKDVSPNNIVYGTFFKVIQNLMPVGEEREELVQTLFDQCCDQGHVDSFVLTQVRYASPSLYRELVEGPCGLGGPNSHDIETVLRNIPIEWSASVVSR